MAAYLISFLLTSLILSTSATHETPPTEEIITMMQEMQRASYFTFVTLLNMVQGKIPRNTTTFLMPSDRALSKTSIPENKTIAFILRHSIPSTLLFDDLLRLPTGTSIPTHEQNFLLKIVNAGKKGFYLNNVKVVSANICTAGSLFRCHGIYGVLNMTEENDNSETKCTAAVEPAPAPSQPDPPPSGLVPVASPGPAPDETKDGSRKASSSDRICHRLFTTIVLCAVVLVMRFHF